MGGQSAAEIRVELTETRKRNGVRSTRRSPSRKPAKTTLRTSSPVPEHRGERTEDDADLDFDEEEIFTNPDLIQGEALIKPAERYSNIEIAQALPVDKKTGKPALSATGVYQRLNSALAARAAMMQKPVDDVRDHLARTRKRNGVGWKEPRVIIAGKKGGSLQGSVEVDEKESPATPEQFSDEDLDAELLGMIGGDTTEEENADDEMEEAEQVNDGYQSDLNSADTTAVNSLISLQHAPEDIEAAKILLKMAEDTTMWDADDES